MDTTSYPACSDCCGGACCSPEPGTLTVSDGTRSTSLFDVGANQWGHTGGIGGIFGAVEPAALSLVCVSGTYTLSISAFNGSSGASAAVVSCSPFAWNSPITGPDGNPYTASVTE